MITDFHKDKGEDMDGMGHTIQIDKKMHRTAILFAQATVKKAYMRADLLASRLNADTFIW
jgi:hypothetical protein